MVVTITAKEKAIELVEKYTELGKDFTRGVSMKEFAKQCALIAVREILGSMGADRGYSFWQEVKQEIEKL